MTDRPPMYAADASPENWTIEANGEGFCLIDAFGEWAEPFTVFSSWAGAERARDEAAREFYANYEPPETGDAWTGGFAENH